MVMREFTFGIITIRLTILGKSACKVTTTGCHGNFHALDGSSPLTDVQWLIWLKDNLGQLPLNCLMQLVSNATETTASL